METPKYTKVYSPCIYILTSMCDCVYTVDLPDGENEEKVCDKDVDDEQTDAAKQTDALDDDYLGENVNYDIHQ